MRKDPVLPAAPASPDNQYWRSLTDPDAVVGAILDLYLERGANRYDEAVTQTEHALQTASHALDFGASDSVVAAALLHDIGHLLMDERRIDAGEVPRDRSHETVGARFLSAWFDDDVVTPIRLHVAAKRYLCATDPDYGAALSPASVRSLAAQGGPMSHDEVTAFGMTPHSSNAVLLRVWDDRAKVPGAAAATLPEFRCLLADLVRGPK